MDGEAVPNAALHRIRGQKIPTRKFVQMGGFAYVHVQPFITPDTLCQYRPHILEHVRDHPIRSGIIQICGRSYSVTLRLDDGNEIPNVESTIVQELYANGALPEYLSYQLNRLHIIED